MQKLYFESAWDRTIAPEDRQHIIHLFEETKENQTKPITVIPIRQDQNHKQDLLVISLIHNFTDQPFPFQNMHISYWEADLQIARQSYSFEHLILESKTSMPWTFIFPKNSLQRNPTFTKGQLIIGKDR